MWEVSVDLLACDHNEDNNWHICGGDQRSTGQIVNMRRKGLVSDEELLCNYWIGIWCVLKDLFWKGRFLHLLTIVTLVTNVWTKRQVMKRQNIKVNKKKTLILCKTPRHNFWFDEICNLWNHAAMYVCVCVPVCVCVCNAYNVNLISQQGELEPISYLLHRCTALNRRTPSLLVKVEGHFGSTGIKLWKPWKDNISRRDAWTNLTFGM